MPNERDLKAEIGHVLFVDIVGYSKLLINEQSELLQELNEMVRQLPQVKAAEANGKLIRLPSGDGMALVFRDDPEAPARCALEISRALQAVPAIQLRMGIHSGPINEISDVNERINIAGAGINVAQRVMDCGDAGHILLSKRVADDLAQYRHWQPFLHELGEFEVKHGVRLNLVNLYSDELGNPARPAKLEVKTAPASISVGRFGSRGLLLAVAGLFLISLGVAAWWFATRPIEPAPLPSAAQSAPVVPEKSVAVLPFENLSEEKKNAYFADGIQDEILTDLAKIADLKVISRTSVMQYRSGAARNLREIGKQLGVAYVLEGSVQRAEGKVRVNAQLIDARTDAHLWAQTYDRDLSDIFAIQSDIAQSIAEQLQAKLAPEEKTRLAVKPTNNPEAYLLYLQANELIHVAASRQEAVDADDLYAQAIALDPNFALARARASMLNSLMYLVGRDPARKIKARALADEALRLAPNLGEAHLALGLCFYRIDRDYVAALKELAVAGAASPNDSEILAASGFVYRRQGRWREALAAFARAKQLDPRRAHFGETPETLRLLRQWPAANDSYEKGLQLEPQLLDGWIGLAYVQFAQTGNPAVASATLDRLPEILRNKPDASEARWDYAMMARDFADRAKELSGPPIERIPQHRAPGLLRSLHRFCARRSESGAPPSRRNPTAA